MADRREEAPHRLPAPARRPVHRGRGIAHRPPRTEPAALSGARRGEPARKRFVELDSYRVEREWKRYEGTPQRDLFRELRERFLERHAAVGAWVLEVGPGPGRFTPFIGEAGSRRVLLDLSESMLREAARRWARGGGCPPPLDLVRGDAARPPFRPGRFAEVAVLGNVLGFAEDDWERTLGAALGLVQPGGSLVLETVVETGERSRYLARLPPGAVRRLLSAPVNAVRPRLEREGFRAEPPAGKGGPFSRIDETRLEARLNQERFDLVESMAVAPALGADPERIAAVRTHPLAWRHLLELEEALGRTRPRRSRAAALLVAGRRRPGERPSGVGPASGAPREAVN